MFFTNVCEHGYLFQLVKFMYLSVIMIYKDIQSNKFL